jgi:hypothetical protein
MVSYETWTSIAFEVARQRGASFSTTQSEIQSGDSPTAQAISVFAEIWNDRKPELQQASESEARQIAEEEVQV